jgi:hypothetical protein
MKALLTTSLVVALGAGLGATPALAKKASVVEGTTSKAVTPEIVDAVADEMKRALKELEIPDAPRPYHISYKITEVEVNDVAASLGAPTSRRNRHFVNLEARVRVGSTELDNGNFVVPNADELDGVSAISLPLEATPRIARRAAWLVTDAAYKEALIQLRAKLDARRAGGGRADVPSWTAEKPLISKDQILVEPLEPLDQLEARARAVSAVFRDQPTIRDSRVAVTSYLERRWYLTSEGTNVTDTRRASGVVIVASGQAEDGQELHQYFLRYGHTARDLPKDDDLKGEAKKLVDNLGALAKAPMIEPYSGPVLFEGEGAVGILRTSLAPHLGGTPLPEGLAPAEAKQFGGALTDKLGLAVLASNLSIVDDPTAQAVAGRPVIGGYKIDDEGVAAQKVQVIKDGTLKTLLLSRTPSQKGAVSNGHARRTADGGVFHGSATNLVVTGKGGIGHAGLVAKLLATARSKGLKYGLIVRRFDDAAITSAPEFSRRELVQIIKSTNQDLPPPATLAYRVLPSGKEELVRGVQLAEVPINAWEDVLAVGTTTMTYNFLAPTESALQLRLTGGTDDGFVPSGGIESSITTPDLLLRRLDVKAGTLGKRALPAVARPAK